MNFEQLISFLGRFFSLLGGAGLIAIGVVDSYRDYFLAAGPEAFWFFGTGLLALAIAGRLKK